MDYFRINYKKLENLHQIHYFVFVGIIFILFTILLLISYFKYTYKLETFYGMYSDNVLKFKINTKLSDILKNNKKIIFNDKEVSYKLVSFEDYEIIDNEVYQTVKLELDGWFLNNEVGLIKLYYDKQKIITYIFDLFK